MCDYTSSLTEEQRREMTKVFQYTVYWKDKRNLTDYTWYRKFFANKKEAKKFAKKYKQKGLPKPYIIRTIVSMSVFRKDIKCEIATKGTDHYYTYAELIK